MDNWVKCELGEVVDLTQGLAINKQTKHLCKPIGLPLLRITDMFSNKYEQFIDENNAPPQCIANKGDLIYTRTGQVGFVFRGKQGVVHNNCFKVIPNSNLDRGFLFWFLNQPSIREQANNIASGSVQLDLPHGAFKSMEIKFPSSIRIQQSISAVFDSLDEKLSLLHKQNSTLEKMAETLFRHWFVEETKQEWVPQNLSTHVDIFNGVSYKSEDLKTSTTAMVTLKSFDRNGGFRVDGFKEYTGKFKDSHVVLEGDLVVAHTDITQEAEVIGNPVLVVGDMRYDCLVISMDLVKVELKTESYLSKEFLYFLMRTGSFKEHCLGYSNGSTVLHLSKKAIPEFEFALPPSDLINRFTSIAKPLLEKQFSNHNQIKTLTKLRDTLLPKLMSGEIKIECTHDELSI